MKRKIIAAISAVAMLFALLQGAALAIELPQILAEDGVVSNAPEVQEAIDQYFSFRGQPTNARSYMASEENGELSQVTELALAREEKIGELSSVAGINFISMSSEPAVRTVTEDADGNLVADIYEWVTVEYTVGNDDTINEMGYAVDHYLTLSGAMTRGLDGYTVIQDENDELDFLDGPISLAEQYPESAVDEVAMPAASDEEVQPESMPAATASYSLGDKNALNLAELIYYADYWVAQTNNTSAGIPERYNPDYGYQNNDCANFVSQCLHAGGIPYDRTGSDYYHTWYPDSGSWISVSKFVKYMTGVGQELGQTLPDDPNGGEGGYALLNVTSTGNNLYPGNPVIKWNYNKGNHITICVGYNSSGTPIINAHNRNLYHAPWQFAVDKNASISYYKTIHFQTYNTMSSTASNATVIPSITSSGGSQSENLVFTYPYSARMYKFTAKRGGSYTISASNTSYLYLYTDSSGSGDGKMYLYGLKTVYGTRPSMTYDLAYGSTYYIMAMPYDSNTANGTLTIKCNS